MALSEAEKQRRYRERHLGVDGTKQRIQCFLSVHAKAQLDRLASYHGYTVTRIIEDLAAHAERAVLGRLPPKEESAYLDGKLQRHGDGKAPVSRRGACKTAEPPRRSTRRDSVTTRKRSPR
jgi:hypothetical protein